MVSHVRLCSAAAELHSQPRKETGLQTQSLSSWALALFSTGMRSREGVSRVGGV